MTGAAFLLLALAMAAAVANWVAVHEGHTAVIYIAKPLTMLLFIAAAMALEVDDPAVRVWFVVALALCLAGDVFLMLPQDLFVFGLGAFLVGHIAYIVGMHVDGVTAPQFFVGIVIVMVALAVIGTAVLRGVRAGPDPVLAGPVVAYMFVISAMVASAIGTGHWAGIAGATLFYASDALIAWNRFIEKTPHGPVTIMVTYHLAQLGLVLSLA